MNIGIPQVPPIVDQHDQVVQPDPAAINQWMATWFAKCDAGNIELAWSDPQTGKVNRARQFALGNPEIGEIAAQLNRTPNVNVYYMAATTRSADNRRSSDDDVVQSPGFWIDQDSEEHVKATDNILPMLRPQWWIVTGRTPYLRRHGYFLTDEVIREESVIRNFNDRLISLYRCDKTTVNPSRLLRCPYTIAWPSKRGTPIPGRIPELTYFTREALCVPDHYTRTHLDLNLPRIAEAPERKPLQAQPSGPVILPDGERVETFGELLAKLRTSAFGRHETLNRLIASMMTRGMPDEAIVLLLTLPEFNVPDHAGRAMGDAEWHEEVSSRVKRDRASGKFGAPDPDPPATTAYDHVRQNFQPITPDMVPDDNWPEPDVALALADTPPPTFPLDLFSATWSSWIKDAARATSAPEDYLGAALLTAAGGLIGNARWAAPNDAWKEPPALYAAVVGLPSTGKSPALGLILDILNEIQKEDNDDWAERARQFATDKESAKHHREKWEVAVKKAAGAGETVPLKPREAVDPPPLVARSILTNDATTEAAAELSEQNPRGMILVRDELTGWIASLDAYKPGAKGSDKAFWLEARSGQSRTTNRKKDGSRPITIDHLTWSIFGGIQPDRLNEAMLSGSDDGFTARFIYFWPAPVPIVSNYRGGNLLDRAKPWLRRLRNLPWCGPDPQIVGFTDEARAELDRWRMRIREIEGSGTGQFISWTGKLSGFAVRLALIFLYLDWAAQSDPHADIDRPDFAAPRRPEVPPLGWIDVDHFHRATRFLEDYCVPMSRRVFGEGALPEAEADSRMLARWLLRQNPIPAVVNVRALRRTSGGPGVKTPARLEAALGELAALGWVRETRTPHPAGGRIRNDWSVNPRLKGP
jgi:hypothetical protein